MAAPSVVLPQGERERESETQRGRQTANRGFATGKHDENTWDFREGGKKLKKPGSVPLDCHRFLSQENVLPNVALFLH